MAIGKDGAVLRQLRTLFNVGTVRELTDGQLLERFATDRDDAAELAFAVLVERHGPMVQRVCRGVLADPHDTQDAFQATFLVLVRKARALWVRDSLGPWLHQVAYRTASCARSSAARRRRHERGAARPEAAGLVEPGAELERLLHQEIDRLPERYRAPVVLCDLEGHTHEQAARDLGLPVGTVKSRLSRGRERLRGRLLRRGLTPDAGLIASALRPDGPLAPISSAIVDSTVVAATRFLTVRSIVRGSAASLAQGVLRSMITAQWLKAASILLVAGATVAGVDLLAQNGTSGAQAQPEAKSKAASGESGPVYEVKPGKLRVTVVDRGSLESSSNSDVYCNVEGRTTIIKIAPEGTKVKKGDIICELDSAALRDQLVNQRIRTESAKASYQNAKLASEVAQLGVKEYTEGVLNQGLMAAKAEVVSARAAIQKAESKLERTRRAGQKLNGVLAGKGGVKTADEIVVELDLDDRLDATEQTLLREKMTLELAQSKLELLTKYTGAKITKGLQIEAERKRFDELARQAAWDLEASKERKLQRQIAACTLVAPIDGLIVYANDPSRSFGANQPQIEEGATVRERQKIISIPDLTRMQVNVKVREAVIDKLVPKMKARIRVDAFPDVVLDGTVQVVAPLPDSANNFLNRGIKVYTTHVRIDNPVPGLRPGMTAQAEILVDELDDVLTVPLSAVLQLDGNYLLTVAVKKPDGGFEWRDVTLGASTLGDVSNMQVEVKEGLKSGESVILNPITLLSDEEKVAKFKASKALHPQAPKPTPSKAKGAAGKGKNARSTNP